MSNSNKKITFEEVVDTAYLKLMAMTDEELHKMLNSESNNYYQQSIENVVKEERAKAAQAVMDLFFALKEIGGTPTLKDLVKLAKRIKGKENV